MPPLVSSGASGAEGGGHRLHPAGKKLATLQQLNEFLLAAFSEGRNTILLIDEAQDVRDLYVRLLRCLGLVRDDVVLLVAGDRNQLVYDFDDADTAGIDQCGCCAGASEEEDRQVGNFAPVRTTGSAPYPPYAHVMGCDSSA